MGLHSSEQQGMQALLTTRWRAWCIAWRPRVMQCSQARRLPVSRLTRRQAPVVPQHRRHQRQLQGH
jgi:hypothetical protein